MLTHSEAAVLVLQELHKRGGSRIPLALIESLTIEKPYGWVFFYNSKVFLGTGIYDQSLVGGGPVLVNKFTNEIAHCGTYASPDRVIRKREDELGW